MSTATAIQNDTAFYLPKNSLLIGLVEQAKTQYPGAADGARIHRAAALVEAGAVTQEGDSWYVLSNGSKYPMVRHSCEDIRHEQAPNGRCKHRWAKTLAKALKEKEQSMTHQRSRQFYASLGHGAEQVHGIATAYAESPDAPGRIVFAAYDSDDSPRELTDHEIVYDLYRGKFLAEI